MSVVHLNKENFESEIKETGNPVIIDFWAGWCGPCQMMGPVFEELSGEYKNKLKFAKLNVDDHPDLANQFGIQGIPALIVLKNANEVDRIVGFAPKEVLKSKIDKALEKL